MSSRPVVVAILGLLAGGEAAAQADAGVEVDAEIVLAVDVSRSMGATDVKPSRLDAAKAAADAFLGKVPSKYRVGLISFGTRAVTTVPPTTNRDVLRQGLAALQPSDGTAIGDAAALAVRAGQRLRTTDGAVPPESVVLISDGAADGGRTPVATAIGLAKKAHVPLYTVLVGTPNGQVQATLTGGFKEIIKVPPSPQTLQRLAAGTGGQFFAVGNDAGLRAVYTKLGSRLGHRSEVREMTDVFAGGSAALVLAGSVLSMLWFRRVLP